MKQQPTRLDTARPAAQHRLRHPPKPVPTAAPGAPVPHAALSTAQRAFLRNHLGLSPRECDVLPGLMNGTKESEIARQLKMPKRTVREHIHRLYFNKLGLPAGSRVLAVRKILESLLTRMRSRAASQARKRRRERALRNARRTQVRRTKVRLAK